MSKKILECKDLVKKFGKKQLQACFMKIRKSHLTDYVFLKGIWYGKEKTIKRIEVSTNVDLTVTIISEKETKKIRIKKGKGISGENLSARGKEFKFIFSTNSAKCQISSPQITFSYL